MPTTKAEEFPIQTSADVVVVRQAVRSAAMDQSLSLVDQTKLVTAASELARNTLDYGGGGYVRIEQVVEGVRKGVRLIFKDEGPGIADIELAMRDGYTSGGGLGLGLGGSKRLVNEFHIDSAPGKGTTITITRWR